MSNPGTSAQGILSKAWIVSANHGRGLLPVADTLNAGDKFGTKLIDEQGTPSPILNTQVYNGADFSFDIYETDIMILYALLYDLDPASIKFVVRPELLYKCKFTLLVVQYHAQTGKVFQSKLLEQCYLSDSSESSARSSDMKVSFKGTATRMTKTKGLGIWYSRVVQPTPKFSTSDDVSFTGSTATISKSAYNVGLPGVDGSTENIICAMKNRVRQDSGITVTGTTVSVTPAPSAYDVWDLFTPYDDTI